MKAHIMIIALLVLAGSVAALPTEVETRPLSAWESFLAGLQPQESTPFYITGGTFSETGEVTRGDTINVKVNIKFTVDALTPDTQGRYYKVELYWVDESELYSAAGPVPDSALKNVEFMGAFYFKTPQKKGDWIEVTIKNAKTDVMGEAFCSKGIKFVGYHYNWDGTKWVKDNPSMTIAMQKSLSNFRLTCPANNPCGSTTLDLGYVCRYDDERYMKQQTPYLQADGSCLINYVKAPCNIGYVCQGGICKEEARCSEGEKRCTFNGLTYEVCRSNVYQAQSQICEQGCSQGTCNEDKKPQEVIECAGQDGAGCDTSGGGNPPVGPVCEQPCTESYVCPGGEVRAECVDGCYVVKLDACPKTPTTTTNTTTPGTTSPGTTPGTTIPPVTQPPANKTVPGKGVVAPPPFDPMQWLSDNPVIAALGAFILVIGGLMVFKPGMRRKRK